VLQEEQTAHIQECRQSCLPDCRNARKQDCTTDGKRERLLSTYPARLNDWLIDGMKE